MKIVRIVCLLILALGMLCGFLAEGPSGTIVGFLLASVLCVMIYYVAGAIADNHISAGPLQEYAASEVPPELLNEPAPGRFDFPRFWK
jgi:hypothetical protein